MLSSVHPRCNALKTYAEGAGSSESNPAPPRPDPLRVWEGSLRPSGIMATANVCLRQGRIRNPAYLYIGVTSSAGAGPNGAPGMGDSGGSGAGLCRILDMNFREFLF